MNRMPQYKHRKHTIPLPSNEFQWAADRNRTYDPVMVTFGKQTIISIIFIQHTMYNCIMQRDLCF
jgi:hypothetical protein